MPANKWVRIIPVATVMYAIAFINRTNLSLALHAMSVDLHFNPVQAGSVAGIFFWGYLILQVPGGYLAERWSTKWFVSILLVVWGTCAAACGLVHSVQQLWVMRFLLGLAEGGMYPATLILLSHWFSRAERARANAWLSIALPLSLAISSPLSGWLLQRWNWRVMLIVEGVFPLLWLLVWVACIQDYPRQASWLSDQEKASLEERYRTESAARRSRSTGMDWRMFLDPSVLLLALIKTLMLSGQLGYLFWLPSALESAQHANSLVIGILYTVPFVIAAISMVVVSAHSDKAGERRAHVAFPMIIGGVSLLAGVAVSGRWAVLAYIMVCFASIGAFAPLGPFWSMPTEWFSREMAGPIAGFVNGIGNLGGFFGPLLVGYINKQTGSFRYGFALLSTFMLLGAAACFLLSPPKHLTAPVASTDGSPMERSA